MHPSFPFARSVPTRDIELRLMQAALCNASRTCVNNQPDRPPTGRAQVLRSFGQPNPACAQLMRVDLFMSVFPDDRGSFSSSLTLANLPYHSIQPT